MTNKLLPIFLFAALQANAPLSPSPKLWVAIGDSITFLNDHPEMMDFRFKEGYETRVVEKLPYIHYINKGYPGWTSENIADSIDRLGLVKADFYSIFLGTNDWWRGHALGSWSDFHKGTGSQTIYGSIRIIIDRLRSLNPKAHLILVTPLPRTDFVHIKNFNDNAFGCYRLKNGLALSQVADAIAEIASRENIDLVNLYYHGGFTLKNLVKFKRLKNPATGLYTDYPFPDYIEVPFNPSTDEYPYPIEAMDMTYDGIHPSDKAYKIIANNFIRVMKQYR